MDNVVERVDGANVDGWRLQVKRTLALQCREETLVTKKSHNRVYEFVKFY